MSVIKNLDEDTSKHNVLLYTPEQRKRRDESVWTTVQGVLAPLQFVVFLGSVALVLNTLTTGGGYEIATASIILKTLILYTIMITGAIWEKVVFGKYLFVEAFFWEDVFSMLVLGLHTLYLGALMFSNWSTTSLLWIALAAYTAYIINAAQFVMKLRKARMDGGQASKSEAGKASLYSQSGDFSASTGAGA